jgi:hypothetical protein
MAKMRNKAGKGDRRNSTSSGHCGRPLSQAFQGVVRSPHSEETLDLAGAPGLNREEGRVYRSGYPLDIRLKNGGKA